MEIKYKGCGRTSGERLFRALFLFFFLFSMAISQQAAAQEGNLSKDSAASSEASDAGGPSLSHLKKNLAAGDEEIKRIQEKARHDEIMSYVYMGVGFSIVIGIAWFTTSLAKKRKQRDDEQKAIRLANMKHKPHHHRR
jgi:hypothetical protein